ncbi:hypothetical protein J5N97_019644 [Dioscorea zingiberensis]|uniref:Uncharacterized protein n=1 Tax=Dioscorea zingiberensis TaxID=325984 RepID=A0A9D5HCW4_9LILI|nr:hypothetical protein J5N97_019644 [Dioscorea zingiberensis]
MAGRIREVSSISSMLVLFVLLLGKVMASNDHATYNGGSEAMQGAETSETWAEWVQGKLSERDNARMAAEQMKEKAGDIAGKAKDKMTEAASGAADITVQKAGEMKDAAGKAYEGAKESLSNAYLGTKAMSMENEKDSMSMENAKDSMSMQYATNAAGKAYEDAKETMSNAYTNAKDSMTMDRVESVKNGIGEVSEKVADGADNAAKAARNLYENAKETMKDSMNVADAKDSMTMDRAKANYEAAKEKVSKATGDVGSQMRAEL